MPTDPYKPTQVVIEIDRYSLGSYSDSYLAALWHVAQVNPAPQFETSDAGDLAERIGREIIRRWLKDVDPELYTHQGHHYYWDQLRRLGKWIDGVFVPGAELKDGEVVVPDTAPSPAPAEDA